MLTRTFSYLEDLVDKRIPDTYVPRQEPGLQKTHSILCECQGLRCIGRINDSWGKDL